jgi:hypothetical protein
MEILVLKQVLKWMIGNHPQESEVITHHYTQNIDLRDARQFCLIVEPQ